MQIWPCHHSASSPPMVPTPPALLLTSSPHHLHSVHQHDTYPSVSIIRGDRQPIWTCSSCEKSVRILEKDSAWAIWKILSPHHCFFSPPTSPILMCALQPRGLTLNTEYGTAFSSGPISLISSFTFLLLLLILPTFESSQCKPYYSHLLCLCVFLSPFSRMPHLLVSPAMLSCPLN